MNILFVIAQIFGVLGLISNVTSMHFRKREHILTALFLVNLFSALNFLCLGHPSSCYIDLFGNAQIIINNFLEKKGKKVSTRLVCFYITTTLLLGLATSTSVVDYIIIIATCCFCFTIIARKTQTIRILWILVLSLYIVYDILVGAYVFAISSSISLISTIIATIKAASQN